MSKLHGYLYNHEKVGNYKTIYQLSIQELNILQTKFYSYIILPYQRLISETIKRAPVRIHQHQKSLKNKYPSPTREFLSKIAKEPIVKRKTVRKTITE